MKQRLIREWLTSTAEDEEEDTIRASTQAFALVREFPMRAPTRRASGTVQKAAQKGDADGVRWRSAPDACIGMNRLCSAQVRCKTVTEGEGLGIQ